MVTATPTCAQVARDMRIRRNALRGESAHGLTFMLRRRERYMASLLVAHWNFCASSDALYSVRLGACVSADAVKTSTSACARGLQ
jgi:hypothetical protein